MPCCHTADFRLKDYVLCACCRKLMMIWTRWGQSCRRCVSFLPVLLLCLLLHCRRRYGLLGNHCMDCVGILCVDSVEIGCIGCVEIYGLCRNPKYELCRKPLHKLCSKPLYGFCGEPLYGLCRFFLNFFSGCINIISLEIPVLVGWVLNTNN